VRLVDLDAGVVNGRTGSLVGAMLHRLDDVEAAMVAPDVRIVAASAAWAAHRIEPLQTVAGRQAEDFAVIHRRDRRRYGADHDRGAARCVGRRRAGDARVHRTRTPVGSRKGKGRHAVALTRFSLMGHNRPSRGGPGRHGIGRQ
jgi:hypothetical protein